MPERSTTEVFEDHLNNRLASNLEGDIKKNYAENVVFLTGTGVLKGHDGVRRSAKELKSYVGGEPFTYKHTLVDGKYAFLEWVVDGKNSDIYDGADGYVIENGKIVMQTIHYSVTKNVSKE